MRRRGPTVPRSSAKLGDSEPGEGDAVIASTWRLSISTDDASTSTDPIQKTDQRRVGTHRRCFQTTGLGAPSPPSPATRADFRTRTRARRTPPAPLSTTGSNRTA